MDWPEITKDTPLEEIKRIHQQIWQYVVENGDKPETPYQNNCAVCEYVCLTSHLFESRVCADICPIFWIEKTDNTSYEFCGKLFYDWDDCTEKGEKEENKLLAEQIRDIPFKYELEKKGAEE